MPRKVVRRVPGRGTNGSGRAGGPRRTVDSVPTTLLTDTELARLHRVAVHGSSGPVVVLGHGLGGAPSDWNAVVAGLEPHCTVITYAQAGSVAADSSLFVPARHRSVLGYVDDFMALLADLELEGITYVGHSFAGIIGALAACADPGLVDRMVLLNASARYLADPATGYVGGFSADQVRALRLAVNADPVAWAREFVPSLMGAEDAGSVVTAMTSNLARHDEEVAAAIASAVFGLDARPHLARCSAETLLLQAGDDRAVPAASYEALLGLLPNARGVQLDATGHFPHRVAADEVLTHVVPFVLGTAQ